MTLLSIGSFLGIMLALAILPSASVALVVTRSFTGGFLHGVTAIVGIVAADLIFVAIALSGMSALALALGPFFSILRYLGGTYLIWLGIKLMRSKGAHPTFRSDAPRSTLISSLAAGFLLTLGDLKAIVFYASLFPTLIDFSTLSALDIAIIVTGTIITVGGVKLLYALSAHILFVKLKSLLPWKNANKVAGGLLVASGGYVITQS